MMKKRKGFFPFTTLQALLSVLTRRTSPFKRFRSLFFIGSWEPEQFTHDTFTDYFFGGHRIGWNKRIESLEKQTSRQETDNQGNKRRKVVEERSPVFGLKIRSSQVKPKGCTQISTYLNTTNPSADNMLRWSD